MISLSCREAAELLSLSREEPVKGLSRLALSIHLAMCGDCRTYAHQLVWIDRALVQIVSESPGGLDQAARQRIVKILADLKKEDGEGC